MSDKNSDDYNTPWKVIKVDASLRSLSTLRNRERPHRFLEQIKVDASLRSLSTLRHRERPHRFLEQRPESGRRGDKRSASTVGGSARIGL